MAFPTRKMTAICEISTSTLVAQNQPNVFEGEVDAMTVEVKFKDNGQDCDISTYIAEMYLFYPSTDEMTDAVDMTISGSSASAAFPEILTAKSGSPLLVIRLKDSHNGNILTACAAPIRIQNVLGKTVITTRPPTPSEVVYIGRAPYISEESGNWMEWDTASGAYVDTGKSATGPQGPEGPAANIDDSAPSATRTYSSQKIESEFSELKNDKVDKANVVNDFTTTEEGFVADARTVQVLNDKIGNMIHSYTITETTNNNGSILTAFGPGILIIGATCSTGNYCIVPRYVSTSSRWSIVVANSQIEVFYTIPNTEVTITIYYMELF